MGPHPKKLIVKTFAPAPSRYAAKIKAKIAADPKQSSPAAPSSAPHPPKPTGKAAPSILSPAVPSAPPLPQASPAKAPKPVTPEAIAWRKARSAALDWLRSAYPALMGPPLPLPLRFGELVCARAFEAGHAVSALKAALARHCRGQAYLAAVSQPESMRHDLDGAPTGPVHASHRAYAAKRLDEIRSGSHANPIASSKSGAGSEADQSRG